MKKLYMVGGTMGVGKTTACRILKSELNNSVFLDGDWCWDMHPFNVTEETKAIVQDNICHLLTNFLRCSVYENIIFCWVMHEQSILDGLLKRLPLQECGCEVSAISLVCRPDVLTSRLQKDVDRGIRTDDIIERSVARLPLYGLLNTIKIDVSDLTPDEVAEKIRKI